MNSYMIDGVTTNSHQACIKCKGNGWVHESTMNHDKAPNQKCFFYQNCNTCNGSGLLISYLL